MWFRISVCVALVQVVSTNLAKHDAKDALGTDKDDTGAVFADVIRNISRVNHALQELISNYEHLQKIYKSQENLESESSDGEIDEKFRNKKNKDGLERSKIVSALPITPRIDGYPATQMIWSDDNDEDSGNVSSDSDSDQALDATDNKLTETLPFKPLEPVKPKHAEIIFVDTHKLKKKKSKHKLEPILEIPTPKPPKTRYNKISYIEPRPIDQRERKNKMKREKAYLRGNTPETNDVRKTTEPSELNTTTTNTVEPKKNVEKKLHSEVFSPMDIWDAIISNRPIQLETHGEVSVAKMEKDNSSKRAMRQRSVDLNPDSIIVTSQNESEITANPLLDSSYPDENDNKDEFQVSVLREAYGDACLKVVVKKCYKACKAAGKEVCKRFKCKAAYKQQFTEAVKTGCIKQFIGNTSEQKSIGNTSKQKSIGNTSKKQEKDEESDTVDDTVGFRNDQTKFTMNRKGAGKNTPKTFEDITRNGYLRSCLPHLQSGNRRSGEIAESSPNTPSNVSEPLQIFNILRDKYESACQKLSLDKCKKACEYAHNKVCESFTCNSSRKKAYKKQCNVKCKDAYKKRRRHRQSSGSSGSSDSDGTSDSSDSDSSSD